MIIIRLPLTTETKVGIGRTDISGTDFVGIAEKDIKAICSGTVRTVAFDKNGWGNYATVQAEDGKRIIYCHMSIVKIKKGDYVKEGQVIGYEGSTGNSTGSHVHLEVRIFPYLSINTIDPIKYIEEGIHMFSYKKEGGIHVIKIPVDKFKIVEWNKPKKTTKIKNYCNAGFFASGKTTTEAMGNLIIDGKVVSETCNSYGNLANKKLHTFYVDKNSNIGFEVTDTMQCKNYRYAISGIPVTLQGQDVSWSKIVKPQGWTGGELYNTKHICLSWKDGYIYIIGIETKTKKGAYDTISEIYKKLKPYEFETVLKLDGGGSTIMDTNGKNVFVTSGNRRVNNLIHFD